MKCHGMGRSGDVEYLVTTCNRKHARRGRQPSHLQFALSPQCGRQEAGLSAVSLAFERADRVDHRRLAQTPSRHLFAGFASPAMDRAAKGDQRNAEQRSIETGFTAPMGVLSIQAKLDSAGRIAIPEEMGAAAEIKGQAVLVGCLDRFEIWSPERYEKVELLDKALLPQALQLVE